MDVTTPNVLGLLIRAQRPRRYNALAAPSGVGVLVVDEDLARVGLSLKNVGSGRVFLSTDPEISAADWILEAGESYDFPIPWAPRNQLFAMGDAGHDLHVWEYHAEVGT
jgi:hypothetical protein